MNVYKTPTGVKIGLMYQKPMPPMDRDSLLVQRAILDPRTRIPRPLLMRLLGRIWEWI